MRALTEMILRRLKLLTLGKVVLILTGAQTIERIQL